MALSPVGSPTTVGFPQSKPTSQFMSINVREVFETHSLDHAKEISKKVNVDIEKKREELRTLVGERYRDLIDAADTIASMNASSRIIVEKLGYLRQNLASLPNINQNTRTGSHQNFLDKTNGLNNDELEVAFTLKLSLEAPRLIQNYLDEKKVMESAHIYLLFDQKLVQTSKFYKWSFLASSDKNLKGTADGIKRAILITCDDMMEDFSTSPKKLAEVIAVKQVLTGCSCYEAIVDMLQKRVKMLEYNLVHQSNIEFAQGVANTLYDIYLMFIDGQVYNTVVKEIRRPKVPINRFGITHHPRLVHEFLKEVITIENAPTVSQLAQILLASFVEPLKAFLCKCFEEKQYLMDQKTFKELNDYQKQMSETLQPKTEDLMRLVIGTSKTLWSEAFYPIYLRKSRDVAHFGIEKMFSYLEETAFPQYKKLDEKFDLIAYSWKGVSPIDKMDSGSTDADLRLKCISPQVAGLCKVIEEQFSNFRNDFQSFGDYSLKGYISNMLLKKWTTFLQNVVDQAPCLFLGRFTLSVGELCLTIWKLMETKDGSDLREVFSAISEKCWTNWANTVADKFSENLNVAMKGLDNGVISVFMPVAEEFEATGEEAVKASIRVPLQISHRLHSNLFELCIDLSRVGPQSVPKNVRENLRSAIGYKVIDHFTKQMERLETPLQAQTAIQIIFDIKFCQWFHLQLKDVADPVLKRVQNFIDPFDMDIVTPRLKVNLKRFLFETHLTLGLLLSEESHSFVAQNFKTKINIGFPMSNSSLSRPLPLLPV